jgi:hypothetical protein
MFLLNSGVDKVAVFFSGNLLGDTVRVYEVVVGPELCVGGGVVPLLGFNWSRPRNIQCLIK